MDLKNLGEKVREPKVLRLLPNLFDFHTKNPYPGYGFKILYKIFRLAYGFLLFVKNVRERFSPL
jgi:hypothetical protein